MRNLYRKILGERGELSIYLLVVINVFPYNEICASVFKVKVLSVSQSYYDKYEMEITRVIKLGESMQ